MSTDSERDASTDRLLKAALRPHDPVTDGACLDAETLAAWADGQLYGQDADRIEAHLADCARCQAMLSAFARSEPVVQMPVPVEAPAPAVIPFRSRRTLRWFVPAAVGTLAAGLLIWTAVRPTIDIPALPTSVAKVEITPTGPTVHSVPSETTAKANRPRADAATAAPPAKQTDSAAARPAPAPASSPLPVASPATSLLAQRSAPVSARPDLAGLNVSAAGTLSGSVTDKDGGLVPGATVIVTAAATGEKLPPQVTNAAGAYSFPGLAPGQYRIAISLQGFKTTQIDATLTAGSANSLSTKLEVGSVSEVVNLRAGTNLLRTDTPTVTRSVSANFSQMLPSSDRNALNVLVFLPGGGVEFGPPPLTGTPAPAAAGGAGARGAGGGRGGGGGGAQRVAQESAGGLRSVIRWRVDAAGQVSKSIDAGRTWTAVTLDRVADVVSGAAPSDSVCWLIGKAGLVLVSVDGATFRRVSAPDTADLKSITAVDALQATVTSFNGATYATTDGGTTWKKSGATQPPAWLQDFQAPSF